MVEFKRNPVSLTFGVEAEFQILDQHSLDLVPRAEELLSQTSVKSLSKELFKSTIELVSPVCQQISEMDKFFASSYATLQQESRPLNLCFAATGTHPFAHYSERQVTPTPRYHALLEQKSRWLLRRTAVYGTHIHLGMRSGDECIRFHNFFLRFVPHLIALSASSPYWHGLDTDLAACRPTMFESFPTGAIPYHFKTWEEYQNLVEKMLRFGSIRDLKDIWWDVRPSPEQGTLEIRICDSIASRMELLAIVAFIQMLGYWFEDHQDDENANLSPPLWVLRENKWRALKDGMEAFYILPDTSESCNLKDEITNWLQVLVPYYAERNALKYHEDLLSILNIGNSSSRQRKKYRETSSLEAVARMNVDEFSSGRPAF